MNPNEDYLNVNKRSWNERAVVHLESAFYDMKAFRAGQNSLKEIELPLLGDVSGKTILHLQCHFGQDTLSLARMGALVTGVDFSETAIKTANSLTEELQLQARFICTDVYDLPNKDDKVYDMVFTSYGTIGWLPDIDRWAQVISHSLCKGGKFVFAEFHPVVWMYDDNFESIAYSYFKSSPIVENETGTYANRNSNLRNTNITWNHSISEVLTALMNAGLRLTSFKEFDYSPYDCFQNTEQFSPGKFRIAQFGNHIPMVYALTAVKD